MRPSLEDKVDKIFEMVHSQNVTIAEALVRNEQYRKELDLHAADIKILTDYKNQTVGKTTVLSLVFGTVGAGIMALIKHFV